MIINEAPFVNLYVITTAATTTPLLLLLYYSKGLEETPGSQPND